MHMNAPTVTRDALMDALSSISGIEATTKVPDRIIIRDRAFDLTYSLVLYGKDDDQGIASSIQFSIGLSTSEPVTDERVVAINRKMRYLSISKDDDDDIIATMDLLVYPGLSEGLESQINIFRRMVFRLQSAIYDRWDL
jgi:hypothetical protein